MALPMPEPDELWPPKRDYCGCCGPTSAPKAVTSASRGAALARSTSAGSERRTNGRILRCMEQIAHFN